jgi:histone H3/H4
MSGPFTYTNRKGKKLYLRKRYTRAGQLRYVFNKEPGDDCITSVPEGWEIAENIHGQVTLRKIKPRPISELEVRTVQRILRSHLHLHRCRAAAKGKTIEVYEPIKTSFDDVIEGKTRLLGWNEDRLRRYENAHTSYCPEMRFVLVDKKLRRFSVERMCYRSWVDGWMSLDREGSLEELAEEFLPHLTRESFFELWPY